MFDQAGQQTDKELWANSVTRLKSHAIYLSVFTSIHMLSCFFLILPQRISLALLWNDVSVESFFVAVPPVGDVLPRMLWRHGMFIANREPVSGPSLEVAAIRSLSASSQ